MTGRAVNLNALAKEDGVRSEISIKSPEDPDDKSVRLRKDIVSFYVKEVGPLILAAVFVSLVAAMSIWIVLRPSAPPIDRDMAWKALLLILGVVLGTVFGKATIAK